MRRKSRLTARTPRQNFIIFIEQFSLVNFFKNPPESFNIIACHRRVSVFHIQPISHPLRHFFPFFFVQENVCLSFFNKFFNADFFFNVSFGLNIHFFFNFNFCRQAVRVPAGPAGNIKTSHCFIAQNDVLKSPGFNVVNAGPAVGVRRPFVKNEFLLALSPVNRLFKNFILFPKFQNLLFFPGKTQFFIIIVHSLYNT